MKLIPRPFRRRPQAPNDQLRHTFARHDLPREAVLEIRDEVQKGQLQVNDTDSYRRQLQQRSGEPLPDTEGNLYPSLLAEARRSPPLRGGSLTLARVPAERITYHPGYALIDTSLSELCNDSQRSRQIAADYAAEELTFRLRVPVDPTLETRPLEEQRTSLQQAIEQNPRVTGFVHGFQSTAAIWDSTAQRWMEHGDGASVGIAFDGYGTDGSAVGDGSAPYTPKQYGFQILEGLDALGLLQKPQLDLVGHSMGGAAVGQMAVAMQETGLKNEARFFMLAPAATPDSTPFFDPCRDPINGTVIGKIYVPAGSSELLGPVVQWIDEKAPFLSRMVVDSPLFLDLGDSDAEIREGFSGYYRALDKEGNAARRDRAHENMRGMLLQDGLTADQLEQVGSQPNFEVHLVSFGEDRLVDPDEVARLDSDDTEYHAFAEGSHTALFSDPTLNQILARTR